jgi:hypothetical protein
MENGKKDGLTLGIVQDSIQELIEKYDEVTEDQLLKGLKDIYQYIKDKKGKGTL